MYIKHIHVFTLTYAHTIHTTYTQVADDMLGRVFGRLLLLPVTIHVYTYIYIYAHKHSLSHTHTYVYIHIYTGSG